MKSLVSSVRKMALRSQATGNSIDFLDHSLQDATCQKIIKQMNSFDLRQLGIEGTNQATDPHHFQKDLNRVTIEGNDDYRLVFFFIKKGMTMPLHDHPNMSVYFKLMFGKLSYNAFDKVEPMYKYNDFSNDQYDELLETKHQILAKKSSTKILEQQNVMLVRPSCNNMHTFYAEEDSCFFDICLPNYTQDSLRRITYFNEVTQKLEQGNATEENGSTSAAQTPIEYGLNRPILTKLEYYTTPPKMPVGFDISEIDYRGEMKEFEKIF